MFGTSQIIMTKKSYMLHLAIRNKIVFIYSARIENGAVSKISYYQIYYREFTELVITPKGNDRRQKTITISG